MLHCSGLRPGRLFIERKRAFDWLFGEVENGNGEEDNDDADNSESNEPFVKRKIKRFLKSAASGI